MNPLKVIFNEIVSLFIDDEFLAVAILIVAGFAGLLRWIEIGPPLIAGAVLFFGCLFVLVASAIKGRTK